jgi:rhamnosyltransferase subunit B
MHALLVPIGSAGDVYPFLGLGVELRRRGHQVTMITAGYFEDLARKAGFDFVPLASREVYLELIGNPDLWHPQRSVPLLARTVIPAIEVVYRLIAERYRPGETAVIAGSLALGARVAQDRLGVALTTLHLQPVVFRSRFQPPIHPGLGWIRQLPVPLRPAVFRLMDFMVDKLYAGPLNAFRAELGLAPVKRVIDRWWHSPDSTLALFPAWYAAPQPDWPSQVRCLDFPMDDGGGLESVSPTVQAFLDAGEPPIVFTSGSAMATGEDFFAASAAAAERMGRRAALLTKFAAQLPRRLPAHVTHIAYAPFSTLLPRAAALVHHGGIGTAAQALRAGVPQLVAPCSYDQFDNAARLERLGVSVTVPRHRYDAGHVTAALTRLLADTATLVRCADCAARFGRGDGIGAAVDAIEADWGQRAAPAAGLVAA